MRKFLLSLLVMLMAGMDYALASTFPTLSTPDKPVLYYIRNTRQDKLVSLGSTTDFMDEIAATEKSQACMFWFESAGELINGTYQPVYIHNITTAKSMGHFNGWNAKGAKWYLRENTVNADYIGIGATSGDEDNTACWWNDNSGTKVKTWKLNGDQGSIWDVFPVPEDEIPAGLTVITWNLKKGDKVVSTVKSAAIKDVVYSAPFDALVYNGDVTATGDSKNQTVDVPYTENIPFVASESSSNPTWYKAILRTEKYLHYDNPEVSCTVDNGSKNDMGSYFAFVGDAVNGFRIYNAALPAGKALGGTIFNRLTAVPEDEAPAFMLENNDNHYVFRNLDSGIGYLNDNSSFLAYWKSNNGSTDGGSTWSFEPVDEKQNTAINNTTVIATAEDFKNFAKAVNDGKVYTNAVMVADIDLGTDVVMVGTNDNDKAYHGTFNGQGHTIKIDMNLTENYAAVFRYVGWRACIENVKIQGTITTTGKFAAGIAGRCRGAIRNCYADVTINSNLSGDATHGGIAGTCTNGTIIENCLAKVAILGEGTQNCGGVIGWADSNPNIVNCLVVSDGSTFDTANGGSRSICRNDGKVVTVNLDSYNQDSYNNRPAPSCYNNYVTNNWGGNNPSVTVVPLADLADGKICYQLNNDQSRIGWVQTIGTDPFPVPAPFGSGRVYASAATGCNGIADGLTYSNSGTAQATAHTFDKYGICTTCGLFDFHYFEYDNPSKFDVVSRSILVGSKEDIDVAEGLNRIVNGFKLHIKMVNDITYIAEPGHFIFNANDWSEGNFNGDGHALTIEMTEMGNNASLFPQRHYGTVENLIMHGKIETSGQYVGSIAADSYESAVRNVYSDINITSSRLGDNTSGGFFGMIRTGKNIENCIYAGTFTLPGAEGGAHCARVGGVAGWTHATTYVTNCAMLGKFVGAGDQTLDDDTENSQNIARNPGNIVAKNVYVLNPITGNAVSDHDKYTKIENPESVANGELAFLLNEGKNGGENFYQLIGTDPQPLPIAKDGAKVYSKADSYTCDGKPQGNIAYVNEEVVPDLPAHEFVDGVCNNCGNLDTDEDGYCKITSAKSLARFSALVNEGKGDMKVRMYDDIDMNGVEYTTAGNTGKLFVGEFDGMNHTISNLTVNGGDYTGLIGVIGGGAVVQNFILDKTCSINGNAFVGAIGGTNGSGHVYIKNIGNEGNVTGAAQNASGILGVDMSGAMTLHINNCYVTGAIKGARESATICSWSNDASVVENCWSIATIEGVYGNNTFTRGGTTVKNGYELEGIGTQYGDDHGKDRTTLISAEDVTNGKLCYLFNENAGENLLGQNLSAGDAYPTFSSNMTVLLDDKTGVYYNPLEITNALFENTENAGVTAAFGFNKTITGVTATGVALIMEKEDYDVNGIYGGQHLFGAVAKNGNINLTDGRVVIDFTSFSGHTAQPIFAGDLDRADVGDVKPEAKYVVIIYGGSIEVEGDVYKDNLVYYCDGAELLSLLDIAVENANADDPTAINGINNINKNAEIYSITGVRVNKAQKGIYIINGIKTAIK